MDLNFNVDTLKEAFILWIPKVAAALLVLIIGFWIANRLTKLFRKAMDRRQTDPTIVSFLGSIVSVGLKVLVLLTAAGMFGIEVTSFIAVISAMAFAVGLALQGSLGHFASGVLLLTFRPYKVGDVVTIGGGSTGAVESIQLFNTVLKNVNNNRIIIPNGNVTSNVITNLSGQQTQGVQLTFGISYGDDIDKARSIILRVIDDCPYVLKEPLPAVVVSSLGDSSVNLTTRPFANSPDYWNAFFYLQENVKKAFDREGISIPFPQMDVHLDK